MKFAFLVSTILFTLPAFAETEGIFYPQRALVTIQGQDTDALELYDAMNVPEVVGSNEYTKRIELVAASTEPIFSIVCRRGRAVVSCTLDVSNNDRNGNPNVIDKDTQHIIVKVSAREDVQRLADLFVTKEKHGETHAHVYMTANMKLHIYKSLDARGGATAINIEYNGL